MASVRPCESAASRALFTFQVLLFSQLFSLIFDKAGVFVGGSVQHLFFVLFVFFFSLLLHLLRVHSC